MDGRRRGTCRGCGTRREPDESFTWAGYHPGCGVKARDYANDAMHFKRGPYFKDWRRQMAASVGGVLLDDVREAR